jgi:hypothetical protein
LKNHRNIKYIMRKLFIVLLMIDILFLLYMLIFKDYLYASLFALGAIPLLLVIGKFSSGGYIENALLAYVQKHGAVSKEQLVEYLDKETQNMANVNITEIVEEILTDLVDTNMITICNNKISIGRVPKTGC